MGYDLTCRATSESFCLNSWQINVVRPVLAELGVAFLATDKLIRRNYNHVCEIVVNPREEEPITVESVRAVRDKLVAGLPKLASYRFGPTPDETGDLQPDERELLEELALFLSRCLDNESGFLVS